MSDLSLIIEAADSTGERGKAMTNAVDRLAASLFSSASIRPVLGGKPAASLQKSMKQFSQAIGLPPTTRHAVFDHAYRRLRRHYRSEYVYKNTLAQRVFIGKHRAKDSTFMQEVPVCGSIADCLFVNGENVIYEIKTELDSPTRLLKQMEDYYKVATRVYVVTHASKAEGYMRLLAGTSAGLITLNRSWGFHEEIPAVSDHTRLSTKALFDLLRVREVEALLMVLDSRLRRSRTDYGTRHGWSKLENCQWTTCGPGWVPPSSSDNTTCRRW